MKRKLYQITATVLVLATLLFNAGCKKLVEVDPPSNSFNGENIFSNEVSAAAVINGIYASMANQNIDDGFGPASFGPVLSGLLSDEVTLSPSFRAEYLPYYRNNLTATAQSKPWGGCYDIIYRTSDAIVGLGKSTTLPPTVKGQLLGSAYFLRAFAYFYLTNLFGDVPLVTGNDAEANSRLPRAPQQKIYDQMVSDLQQAKAFLAVEYKGVDGKMTTELRITPNRAAASALLSRVYLYMKDYANAETEASNVISQTGVYNLAAPEEVFLSNSPEAIWQLQPVQTGWNTPDAKLFVLRPNGPDFSHPFYLSSQLLDAFESKNDLRYKTWIGERVATAGTWYFANKYKSATFNAAVTEYKIVLRLAELYLIRAEARAWQNNLSGAKEDLKAIRERAKIGATLAQSQQELLDAIQHERRVELFTEFGDRWLNLKRTQTIDVIMTEVCKQKGAIWASYKQLLPLPLADVTFSLQQNQGY